ncbi:MAG: hypothetical protein NVS2B6_17150 [Thermoleophilaceae bacterium]
MVAGVTVEAKRAREILEEFESAALVAREAVQIRVVDEPLTAITEWIFYRDGKCRWCHREQLTGSLVCAKHGKASFRPCRVRHGTLKVP